MPRSSLLRLRDGSTNWSMVIAITYCAVVGFRIAWNLAFPYFEIPFSWMHRGFQGCLIAIVGFGIWSVAKIIREEWVKHRSKNVNG